MDDYRIRVKIFGVIILVLLSILLTMNLIAVIIRRKTERTW